MARAGWLALAGLTSIGGCTRTAPPPIPPESPVSPPPVIRSDDDDVPGPSAPRARARDAAPAFSRPTAESVSPEPSESAATPRRYVVLPEVRLSPEIEAKVARIAEAYFGRTGKELGDRKSVV